MRNYPSWKLPVLAAALACGVPGIAKAEEG